MPTARELLEQADALMRRNRGRTETPANAEVVQTADDATVAEIASQPTLLPMPTAAEVPAIADVPDIPELTDVVAEPALDQAPSLAALEHTPSFATLDAAVDAGLARSADVPGPAPSDEVAAIVAEIEAAAAAEPVVAEGEPSVWLDEAALGEASVTGPAPDSVLVVEPAPPAAAADALGELPPLTLVFDEVVPSAIEASTPGTVEAQPPIPLDEPPAEHEATPTSVASGTLDGARAATDAGTLEVAPAAANAGTLDGAPASAGHDDMARWEALAEEIRMQVLQRIDIFTDTGLKAQLDERLKPVVDRASAELVGTVSQHVGQLLRAYVAEAIEREIDKWRRDGG